MVSAAGSFGKNAFIYGPAAEERGADPSEAPPRRGGASVPEKHSQAGR